MSDYIPKVNKGTMHINQYKKKDNHPDYRGQLNVNGHVYDISGWVNTDKNQNKYLNVSIDEPYVKPEQQLQEAPQQAETKPPLIRQPDPQAPPAIAQTPDLDDKIPF